MVIHGDLFDVLPTLQADSVDACVTDPPYDYKFMGKAWDGTGVAFDPATWRAVLRVLKPGAYLVACGGTRTSHRMVCAIEDAGFEIRDSLVWLYGSGFPKSLDVGKAIDKVAGAKREVIGRAINLRAASPMGEAKDRDGRKLAGQRESEFDITAPSTDAAKQWDGWGTALKPCHEPIVLARKPFTGTVASNVLQHGTGALNIDGCRIEGLKRSPEFVAPKSKGIWGNAEQQTDWDGAAVGRWPPNVLLDSDAAAMLDEETGITKSPSSYTRQSDGYSTNNSGIANIGESAGSFSKNFGDTGGASRFFYVAKASQTERDAGGERNTHPTVKPLALMRWIVRLVTPPNGIVLDTFGGSGTTGMACRYENRDFILIEKEQDYIDISTRRIDSVAPLFTEVVS